MACGKVESIGADDDNGIRTERTVRFFRGDSLMKPIMTRVTSLQEESSPSSRSGKIPIDVA